MEAMLSVVLAGYSWYTGSVIYTIWQDAHNSKKLLACRVDMLVKLLPHARMVLLQQQQQGPEAVAELEATLSEAHELVMSWQRRGRASKFFVVGRMADRFRRRQKKIESYLSLIQESVCDADYGTPMPLTLNFLKSITRDFSDDHVLGRGGFGVVYKGILGNGKKIAVKKLRDDMHPADNDNQFHKEVAYLSRLKHQNIVRLIGYCDESTEEGIQQTSNVNYVKAEKQHRLIIVEYLSNKSLDNYLSDESSGLEWPIRFEIIKGILCGLHYLHKECNIVHLDLKPQNILMDDNMVPKIADFGLSRLFGEQQSWSITTNCRGTLGYMAQEYINNGLISTKSDIFSLGVMIIELLIGSKEYPHSYEAPFEHFIEDVVRRWRNKLGKTRKDEHLEIYCRQVKQCIEIGMKCVDPDPKKRPAAWDVIEILNATSSNLPSTD